MPNENKKNYTYPYIDVHQCEKYVESVYTSKLLRVILLEHFMNYYIMVANDIDARKNFLIG